MSMKRWCSPYRSFRLVTGRPANTVRVIVERRVLHESRKDKEKADGHEEVHGGDV